MDDGDPLDDFFESIETERVKPTLYKDDSSDEGVNEEQIEEQEDSIIDYQPKRIDVLPNEPEKELPPLKKNIYIESDEIKGLTQDNISKLRQSLGDIKVHGIDVPCPIKEWSQCGLPEQIMARINYLSFVKPTSIQCQAIPCVLSGRDVIGCAVTGSGKTLAFVLPAISHIIAQAPLKMNESICIFLAPTRELAEQTFKETTSFLKLLDMKAALLVGGNDVEEQVKSLKNGAHVIVGTPGRFIDLITSNKTFNIKRASFLVIDEADRMFDLGFEPQVIRIAQSLRSDRQTMMFSATFPHSVERCARKLLMNPIEIVVGQRNVVSSDVEQTVEIVKADQKFPKLLLLLSKFSEKGQTIVFTNTQERAEELYSKLINRGYKVGLLHAGMQQSDRASLLHDFRQNIYNVMVVTSVGSRGIDIITIVLVVNYDAPDHEADYVHRIGRTGRAGNHGWAVTFVEPQETTSAKEIISAMIRSKAPIPAELEQIAKTDGAKRKWGFGGHGFKFDKNESEKFKSSRLLLTGTEEGQSIKSDNEDDEVAAEATDDVDPISLRPDGKYVTKFFINDFTFAIRMVLTRKERISNIMDDTGTYIIQRGMFTQPGAKPPPGEQKLHLLIEGPTKYSVQVAFKQLEDMAKETDTMKQAPQKKFKI